MGLANFENSGMTVLRPGIVRDGQNIYAALAAGVPRQSVFSRRSPSGEFPRVAGRAAP
jgi:hypothetical protein